MTDHLLVLHSTDPLDAPDRATLIRVLRAEGLLGEPVDVRQETHYLAGERFLQGITFLGCSPTLYRGDGAGPSANHIQVSPLLAQPVYLGGDNTKPPACPHCRRREPDWRAMLAAWQQAGMQARHHCPQCGQSSAVHTWNWREYGGFGRLYLAIWGITEGIAVPADGLLASLANISHHPWRYFYFAGQAPTAASWSIA